MGFKFVVVVIVIAGLVVTFIRNKRRMVNAYKDYYAQKRKEFPWLDTWINEHINPATERGQSSTGWRNFLSVIIVFVFVLLAGIFFEGVPAVQLILTLLAFVAAELWGRRSVKNQGKCESEEGLTLECPSCHCPHAWVMPQKENIVEHEETTTEKVTRKGYGKGDIFDSALEGFKQDGTTETVTVVYTGKSIKDFKCLNCGHTERNEYNERWVNKEPDEGLLKFHPPKAGWEIPSYLNKASVDKAYEQAKVAEALENSTAAPAQTSQGTQGAKAGADNAAGINPALLKAAELGSREACCDIALKYLLGRGVEEDHEQAAIWLEKSRDEDGSMYSDEGCNEPEEYFATDVGFLGFMEFNKDPEAAVKLYQIAAELENAEAFYNLGRCYDKGEGIAQNEAKAIECYEKAAEQGHKEAKAMLKSLKKSLK